MGELYILHQSFELSQIDQNNRDKVVLDYCECLNKIIKNKDSLYAHEVIDSYKYSYGDLYNGFIYKPWSDFKIDPNLHGITLNTYNLFYESLCPLPGLINDKIDQDIFFELFNDGHLGFNGFEFPDKIEPYIHCRESYENWYELLDKEISWEDVHNKFLPLATESNKILLKEIYKNKLENLIESDEYRDKIGCLFHDKIMRHKGSGLLTYTMEIGRKVLLKNKYIYDSQLSNAERIAAGNSLRHIYFIDSPDGKRYISLDFKHGMFEFFDSKGHHCGEFKFDGTFNSKAEETHNLKTV